MKIFIDSGLLIEYEKQTKSELQEALLASEHQIFINAVVASEYLYQLLGILGGRSPMSICESGKIGETLALHNTKAQTYSRISCIFPTFCLTCIESRSA